jgi:hypothetical protein
VEANASLVEAQATSVEARTASVEARLATLENTMGWQVTDVPSASWQSWQASESAQANPSGQASEQASGQASEQARGQASGQASYQNMPVAQDRAPGVLSGLSDGRRLRRPLPSSPW